MFNFIHVQPNDRPPSLYSCISILQAANAGKSLFLLYALKRSPRLTLFYLYLFDYSETFLPFLHTCCPAIANIDHSLEGSFLNTQVRVCGLPDRNKYLVCFSVFSNFSSLLVPPQERLFLTQLHNFGTVVFSNFYSNRR